jgi:hypothetical protein
MIWIAPSEKDLANGTLAKRLWDSADQFRANSGLKAQEYSGTLLKELLNKVSRSSRKRDWLRRLGLARQRNTRYAGHECSTEILPNRLPKWQDSEVGTAFNGMDVKLDG